MQDMDAHDGALFLTNTILAAALRHIPQRTRREHKSTHPWVNARVQELVEGKKAAQDSSREEECTKACSKGIMEEYGKYVARESGKLQGMPGGCKQWWSIARRLMQRKGVCSSIPALRNSTKQRVLDATKCKADLFVETFFT